MTTKKVITDSIMDRIWDCINDMIEYEHTLEKTGCKESGAGLREVISKAERLCDWMYEHPGK